MAYNIDPDQSVSIVAIFLFIDAAFLGFPLLSSMMNGLGFRWCWCCWWPG
jgi:hypothetical protein